MKSTYFITAIGTDCGKTVASAVFAEAMDADYWKPIQSGLPRDSDTVAALVSNSKTVCHREAYLLTQPLSPHASAAIDGVNIELAAIQKPKTDNDLIIEGAGGLLVPLNQKDFVIDLAQHLEAEVILVINFYLGSINHTLLSLEALQKREQKGLKIRGIVFNGHNQASLEIIKNHCDYPAIRLPFEQGQEVSKEFVSKYAKQLAMAMALGMF